MRRQASATRQPDVSLTEAQVGPPSRPVPLNETSSTPLCRRARSISVQPIDVRDTFSLTLVPSHPKQERCEVVWRRGKTYGVKFLT